MFEASLFASIATPILLYWLSCLQSASPASEQSVMRMSQTFESFARLSIRSSLGGEKSGALEKNRTLGGVEKRECKKENNKYSTNGATS